MQGGKGHKCATARSMGEAGLILLSLGEISKLVSPTVCARYIHPLIISKRLGKILQKMQFMPQFEGESLSSTPARTGACVACFVIPCPQFQAWAKILGKAKNKCDRALLL